MSATLTRMEYIKADILSVDQLMQDDLIEILDEDGIEMIVQVQEIISMPDNYLAIVKDEFGELLEIEFADDAKVNFYILM
jgi:hypothetical protein